MITREEVNQLLQTAQETLETAVKAVQNPFWPDFYAWAEEFQQAGTIVFDRDKAIEYLREAKIDSYAALEDRYRQVIEMASLRDEKEIRRRFEEETSTNPMLRGYGGSMLNVMDFLVAIPHIPQPPDPSRPTVLGMFLSAMQQVTTNESIYIKPVSDNLFMHPSLVLAGVLALNSRTTDGGRVADLYAWEPKETAGVTPVARPFTLEQFRIHNAVAFAADRMLLTGEWHEADGPTPGGEREIIQVQYNVFERDQATFLVGPASHLARRALPAGLNSGLAATTDRTPCPSSGRKELER